MVCLEERSSISGPWKWKDGEPLKRSPFWYETGNEMCKALKLTESYLRKASLGPSVHTVDSCC